MEFSKYAVFLLTTMTTTIAEFTLRPFTTPPSQEHLAIVNTAGVEEVSAPFEEMIKFRNSLVRVNAAFQKRKFVARPFSTSPSVTLFQYAICPFCNKTKALLAYAGIDHKVVEVNPLTKAELKPWSGDYRKVPIALIDDKQVNGSDEIMTALLEHPHVVACLEERWSDMTIDKFTSSPSATRWSTFANDDLAPLLYPNICRSLSDSYAAFSYVNGVDAFSPFQKFAIRGIGSLAMYFAASKVKAKRRITDEQQALDDALTSFEEDGLKSNNTLFVSGTNEPNIGDITVFGTLRAVEGLPAHSRAIKDRGGTLMEWYKRMKDQVYTRQKPNK